VGHESDKSRAARACSHGEPVRIASWGAAGVFTVAPLTVVSGPSPFAGCTAGTAPGSVLYTNAEEEPWVDVNPKNPNDLIAVWQQDRWSDGGAHGLVTAVSHNGGVSWTETFPHFSVCAGGTAANGGNYDRASDPWVSFGGDGTAYQVSLSFNANDATNAVLASRSTDSGNTWSEPFTIIRDSGDRDAAFAFNDKESVTADPATAGYAYAVWDRFVTPGPTSRASIEGYFNSRVPGADLVLAHHRRRPDVGARAKHLRPQCVQWDDRKPDPGGVERRPPRLLRRVLHPQELGQAAGREHLGHPLDGQGRRPRRRRRARAEPAEIDGTRCDVCLA
jgi:hypothetical protein